MIDQTLAHKINNLLHLILCGIEIGDLKIAKDAIHKLAALIAGNTDIQPAPDCKQQ